MTKIESLTMSISKDNLNCQDILKFMQLTKIPCNIIKNKTVSKNLKIENGCMVFIPSTDKYSLNYKIWNPIRAKYNLNCAHIDIPYKFNGCIYDYLKQTGCPFK